MMKRNLPTAWKALALGVVIALPGALQAATDTTTFTATATVTDSCAVSATNLAFGSFSVVDNADVDATSSVTVTCSNGSAYEVALDDGLYSELGTVATRRMNDGGTNYLSYQMYDDALRSSIWGETTLVDVVAGTGDGADQVLTVYGRVPSGQQSVASGSYTDTVTVTVTF